MLRPSMIFFSGRKESRWMWYVARISPGSERAAAEWLSAEGCRRRCEERGRETSLPLRGSGHVVRGRTVVHEHALFAGYLFVGAVLASEVFAGCAGVPGLWGFLGGEEPEAVDGEVVEDIRSR